MYTYTFYILKSYKRKHTNQHPEYVSAATVPLKIINHETDPNMEGEDDPTNKNIVHSDVPLRRQSSDSCNSGNTSSTSTSDNSKSDSSSSTSSTSSSSNTTTTSSSSEKSSSSSKLESATGTAVRSSFESHENKVPPILCNTSEVIACQVSDQMNNKDQMLHQNEYHTSKGKQGSPSSSSDGMISVPATDGKQLIVFPFQ